MTSKQVMLTAIMTVIVGMTCGCDYLRPDPRKVNAMSSPYQARRVWAVAPMRNESGSQYADGLRMADQLARHLETAANLDTLAVNRTLAAMTAMDMRQIASPTDAMKLLAALGADGLIVGSITAWDPYDPPKIGVALELYTSPKIDQPEAMDTRTMTSASTMDGTQPRDTEARPARQPASVTSGYYDAADPRVRDWLVQFADQRGPVKRHDDWHRYRISMDLYSDFVSFVSAWRMLEAERQRVTPPPQQQADANHVSGRE